MQLARWEWVPADECPCEHTRADSIDAEWTRCIRLTFIWCIRTCPGSAPKKPKKSVAANQILGAILNQLDLSRRVSRISANLGQIPHSSFGPLGLLNRPSQPKGSLECNACNCLELRWFLVSRCWRVQPCWPKAAGTIRADTMPAPITVPRITRLPTIRPPIRPRRIWRARTIPHPLLLTIRPGITLRRIRRRRITRRRNWPDRTIRLRIARRRVWRG